MEQRIKQAVADSIEIKRQFFDDELAAVARAAQLAIDSLRKGGKALLFGNGGSASDAEHIASELINNYAFDRPGLPAIALTSDSATLSAISIDSGFDYVFARQVQTLAQPNDFIIAISTSGNSANVVEGVKAAKTLGLKSIGLLGRDGGRLAQLVTVPLIVPSRDTARIQEVHSLIGHILCDLLEHEFFGRK